MADMSVTEVEKPTGLAVLPWIAAGVTEAELPRLGEVRRPDGRMLATVSGGWSADALHLGIDVMDADHVAAANANVLWSADSVEIGLDLAGDGAGELPPETSGPIGADDVKLIFGLIAEGPAAIVLASRQKLDGAALAGYARIVRTDGPEPLTRYRLDLPWAALGQVGGARPTVGLDIQVNARDGDEPDKTPHHWGDGLRGGFTAAKLRQFALGEPSGTLAAVAWDRVVAWTADDRNQLCAGIRSEAAVPLALELSGQRHEVVLPGGPGMRFFRVGVPVQADGSALTAAVPGGTPAVAEQVAADEVYGKLMSRLGELEGTPGIHPLFRAHLASVAALAASEWGRILLQRRSADPRKALASLGHYRDLLAGFRGEAGQWASYRDGRRSLIMAYVSPHDQTVQYYYLGLPRDWDETRAYPLFFELHGAGDDHPLAGPAMRLGAQAKAMGLHGYETPKVYAEIDRTGYWVHPFGRGNLGYVGIARVDVLEAYDHAHRLVRIDPERRYLYGFSMGGGGTFSLAMRTPSRWAAACVMAGAAGREPVRPALVANLKGLPLKIMCGEDDSLAGQYRFMLGLLAAQGIVPEARLVAGIGHRYTMEVQTEALEWLKGHVRQRPKAFAFATDDNLTGEAWGVRLHVDNGTPIRRGGPGASPRVVADDAPVCARAEVRIEGQKVEVESENAWRLSLDFSTPDGLGLDGEVVVVWNGTEAYRGPARPLDLE